MADKYPQKYIAYSCQQREKEPYMLGGNDLRRWYQRDIDQITHSTKFRKLQQKSQLLSEKDPRSRSRMIHTIEVSRTAMEISEQLNASKELTEAICYAHDIATAPYGYIGNKYLMEKAKSDFSHELAGALQLLNLTKKKVNEDDEEIICFIDKAISKSHSSLPMIKSDKAPFSLYVSKETTHSGREENIEYFVHHISPEIIDGVMNHGSNGKPNTIEGQIVRVADNIAYLSQDIEDLISTGIINPQDFSKYAQQEILKYKISGDERELKWNDVDNTFGALTDSFHKTRGRRIAVLIDRFVRYNLHLLNTDQHSFYHSKLLGCEIPELKIDHDMQAVIDFIWSFTESKYSDTLIDTSNHIQKQKMEELWAVIHDERFTSQNISFRDFIQKLNASSLFHDYSDDWKCAFFISHLSYKEVDLILDSFHERNFTFELDIKER